MMQQQSKSSEQAQILRIFLAKMSGSFGHSLSDATVARLPTASAGDMVEQLYQRLTHLRRYLALHHSPAHWLPPLSDDQMMLMLGRIHHDGLEPRAMCFAAMSGDKACVAELIARGADVNECDDYGITPVMYAALFGHHDLAEYLLEQQANLHHHDNQGRTLYHCAAFAYDTRLMEYLRVQGLDPEACDHHHCTADHYTAWGGQDAGIKAIRSRSVDEASSSSATPGITLENALMVGGMELLNGKEEFYRRPISERSTINKKQESPYYQHQSLAHWITIPLYSKAFWELERHDFFTYYDYNRQSVFMAARHGHLDAFKYLLLEAQCQAPPKAFLDDHAMKAKDEHGKTALHYFAISHALAGVQFCHEKLNEKAEFLTILDNDGNSVVHAAALGGCVEVMRWVVAQADDKLTLTNKLDQTPLHFAALSNNPAMIDECLALGCELDAKDTQGLTALDHAYAQGCLSVVQALQAKGATLTKPAALMRNPNPSVIHWVLKQQGDLPLSKARYQQLTEGMLAVNNHVGSHYCRRLHEVEKSLQYFSKILSSRADNSMIDHTELSKLVTSVKEQIYENTGSSQDITAACDRLISALPATSNARFRLGRSSRDSAVKKLTSHLETLKEVTRLSIHTSPTAQQEHVANVSLQ